MEGSWYTPDQEPDDNETKAEKKDKKNPQEVMRKASLLELFQAQQKEKAPKEEDTAEPAAEKDDHEAEDATIEATTAETLSPIEQQIIAEQLVDDRLAVVEAELEQDLSPEDAVMSGAAAEYLERVATHLEEGQLLNDELLEQAEAETVEALQAEAAAEPEAEILAELPEPDEDDPTTPPPTTPSTTSSPSAAVPPISSTSATSIPGVTPVPAAAAAFAIPSMPLPTPNVLSTPPTTPEKHSHTRYVLAGGLIGYLIGRRSGRIKTEARLKPIQKNLEQQVETMKQSLVSKEQTIRRLAAAKVTEALLPPKQTVRERVAVQRQQRAEKLEALVEKDRKSPEWLGKFALTLPVVFERPTENRPLADKELLEVAATIPFERGSIAELYRAGRITTQELRDIVGAYLTGKSYERLTTKLLAIDSPQLAGAGVDVSGAHPSHRPHLSPAAHNMHSAVHHQRLGERKKDTHLAVRFGMAAALATAVVFVAIMGILWMFRSL